MKFTRDSIKIDSAMEAERIANQLKNTIASFHKKGAIVGVSGGIDSSVVLALCIKALGNKRVLAVMLPEKESNPDSLRLGKILTSKLSVPFIVEDITKMLDGFECYRRRDEAVKRIFPEYDKSYRMKITLLKDNEGKGMLNFFNLIIVSPDGEEKISRLPLDEYRQIVAASDFKQRCRMSMLYYYAEMNHFSVIGTGNKNEHDLGFFVKFGDGAADIMPIAHLLKTQVNQLAEYLEIPEEIQRRIPTTDTYSAEQTQEEFFFREPFNLLDLIWFGWENGISSKEISKVLELDENYVKNVIDDIENKIKATEYLRENPIKF